MKSETDTRSVNQLVEMGKKLLLEGDIDAVLTRAMDSAIELCRAERGLIIFFDDQDQPLIQTARNFDRQDIDAPEFEISQTIIAHARKNGQPLCIKNAYDELLFRDKKSVVRLKLLSILCVPLIQNDRVFGLIYLDNRTVRGIFSEEQCSLLLDFADFILVAASRCFEIKKLRNNISALEIELRQRYRFDLIVGHHPQILEILKTVAQISASDISVLIQGETGVGKELIARTLHFNSHRCAKPFIPINCSAIPESLIESELFGHSRGAYTGAVQEKEGLFHKADGGTIFLDEIGELPLSLQPKLLRILQTGEYLRLGNDTLRFVNVRVIAATSKSLRDLILAGRFRDDLYYRLNIIEFTLPPLRHRRDDIPLLVDHFFELFKTKHGKTGLRNAKNAMAKLLLYDYPGNIRELENIIQRAVVMAEADLVEPRHLPSSFDEKTDVNDINRPISPFRLEKQRLMDNFEKEYLIRVLKKNRGNITHAAKMAGMNVKNFHTKMKKYHLSFEQFRG
jgi:transcriptional regulator with GAF, ATPase, and Fis domain